MKNPLNRRILREIKQDFGKYLVICLMIGFTIALVSGCIVSMDSIKASYDESFDLYNIEDGNFETENKLNQTQSVAIEAAGVTVYENFYREVTLDNANVLRLFSNRTQVNQTDLWEGDLPDEKNEIAIDRTYASHNNLEIGDTISGENRTWTIVGLVSLPDYSALFRNNNDMMFDALTFGVAVVSEAEFETYDESGLTYNYSWLYQTEPADEVEESDMAEDLLEVLIEETSLEEFLPQYANQAITFTGDDLGSDQVMITVLLYIVVVILAFVFVITISNTIMKEAAVIGTLRAMGYTKGELIRHYMVAPMVVTVFAAVWGNVLGYTVCKGFCTSLEYESYSLVEYTTRWNTEAFLKTTLVPIVIMIIINWAVLSYRLGLSPLKFLRRDLKRRITKHVISLPKSMPFFSRFHLRVLMQNTGNYVILFIGILFANILLMFGMGLPSVLDHYEETISENMLSNYQYILSIPTEALGGESKFETLLAMAEYIRGVSTDNEDAEKFSAYELRTCGDDGYLEEAITIYGIQANSRYIALDLQEGDVYISQAMAEKYELVPGDSITLTEEYEDTTYTFEITGIYDYEGAVCLFMPQDDVNTLFDLGDDTFSGYFSDTQITDIEESYVGQSIDVTSLTALSRQLTSSFRDILTLVDVFSVVMFVILVYLLSKVVIEKNAQSISMTKILGYSNAEICRLYIVPTSVLVVVYILLSLAIVDSILGMVVKYIFQQMTGWITFYIEPSLHIKVFALGVLAYAVVAWLEFRKIKGIPMEEALKNVE